MEVKTFVNKLLGRFSSSSEPEYNSGVPIAMTPDVETPLSIEDLIRKFIREKVSAEAEDEGYGSFDDEDDFEEEDPDGIELTHHQVMAMTDDELRDEASAYGITLDSTPAGSPGEHQAPAPGAPVVAPQAPLPPTPTPPAPSP